MGTYPSNRWLSSIQVNVKDLRWNKSLPSASLSVFKPATGFRCAHKRTSRGGDSLNDLEKQKREKIGAYSLLTPIDMWRETSRRENCQFFAIHITVSFYEWGPGKSCSISRPRTQVLATTSSMCPIPLYLSFDRCESICSQRFCVIPGKAERDVIVDGGGNGGGGGDRKMKEGRTLWPEETRSRPWLSLNLLTRLSRVTFLIATIWRLLGRLRSLSTATDCGY